MFDVIYFTDEAPSDDEMDPNIRAIEMGETSLANLELGNRYPNSAGIYSKTCPLCCKQGLGLLPLDETHLLFFCKSLERVRKQQNITNFITESQYPRISRDDLLRKYISNPDTTTTELMRRGRAATILKEKWLSLL